MKKYLWYAVCLLMLLVFVDSSYGLNIGLDSWTTKTTFLDSEEVELNVNVTNNEVSLSPKKSSIIIKVEEEITRIPIDGLSPEQTILKKINIGEFKSGTYRVEIYVEYDFFGVVDKTQTQYQQIRVLPSEPIKMELETALITSVSIPKTLVAGKKFEIEFKVNSSTDSAKVEFGLAGEKSKTKELEKGMNTIKREYSIEKDGSYVFEVKTFTTEGDNVNVKDYRTESLIVTNPDIYEPIEKKKIEQNKGNVSIELGKKPERNLIEEVGCFIVGGCKGDLTAPEIKNVEILKGDSNFTIHIQADDRNTGNSNITGCRIILNEKDQVDMQAADGSFDSPLETVIYIIPPFSGNQAISFQCTDLENNIGYSSISAQGKIDVLLITVGRKIDKDQRFISTLATYVKTLKIEGLTAKYLELDSSEFEAEFGTRVKNSDDGVELKSVIDRLVSKTNPRYLLILGGVSVIPMPIAPTTAQIPTVPVSDDVFGDVNNDGLPDISVSRIPTPSGSRSVEIISTALESSMKIRNKNSISRIILADTCMHPPSCIGLHDVNRISNIFFGHDCDETGDCKKAPPFCAGQGCDKKEEFYNELVNYDLLHMDFHGNPYSFAAHNSDGWYDALDSSILYEKPFNKNPIFSTVACHSSTIDCAEYGCINGKGSVFSFLGNGASVYIGSTRYGYAGSTATLIGEVMNDLKNGKNIGDAMLEMKRKNLRSTSNEMSRAIVYELQLYGDPTIRISGWKNE